MEKEPGKPIREIARITPQELKKDANIKLNKSLVEVKKDPNNLPKKGYLVDEVKLDEHREKLNNLKIELLELEKELDQLNVVDFKQTFNITSQKEILKHKIKSKSDEICMVENQIKMSENKRKINFQNMMENN